VLTLALNVAVVAYLVWNLYRLRLPLAATSLS